MEAMKNGKNIKEWEGECYNVTTEYFEQKKKKQKKHAKHKKKEDEKEMNESILPFVWTFAFGVSIGVGTMMFVTKYNHWFGDWKYESI